MISIPLNTETVVSRQQVRSVLQEKIEYFSRASKFAKQTMGSRPFVRLKVNIEALDLHRWLIQQTNSVKMYWQDRENLMEMAGVGTADLVQGDSLGDIRNLFQTLSGRLPEDLSELRYYGGLRFNNEVVREKCWEPFGSYWFVIPQFEILREANSWSFACNFKYHPENNVRETLEKLSRDLTRIRFDSTIRFPEVPVISAKNEIIPGLAHWEEMISRALRSFRENEIEKVVLARKLVMEFLGELEPLVLSKYLQKNNENAFHFCCQPCEGYAFLGATPERLYSRSKQQFFSEAVAGTRSRGVSPDDDLRLERELFASEKDHRELHFVVKSLREALEQLCLSSDENEAVSVLKLTRLQHLYAQFQGILKKNADDGLILKQLHPTPAVGGYPRKLAMNKIEALEPFDRGWYAGPIGWIGADAAEFVVAIRSGLVAQNKLHLYAGAGIVEGSSARKEWNEIDNKLANFTNMLKSNHDKL